MMNTKGFSLMELLATITILGILMVISVAAYSIYKQKTIDQAYATMSANASSAAEEYFMDNMTATSVEFSRLVEDEYLSETIDPRNSAGRCSGTVTKQAKIKGTEKSLDVTPLKVELKCSNFSSCIIYPDKKKC